MTLDFSHSRLTPFQHQLEDTERLVNSDFLFIASEMRTGKSKIVIDALQFLYHDEKIERVIIFAPAPVRDVWFLDIGELQKHLWHITPVIVKEFHARIRQWSWGPKSTHPLEIICTNYEFCRSSKRLMELLSYCTKKTFIVGDESSYLKTHNAKQTESFYTLRWHCARVALLNGTPISHNPKDLYSQGNILHPKILQCKSVYHFLARYAVMGGYKVNGRPTQIVEWINLDDLQRRFAPYTIRRLQKDCLDLPPKLDPVTLTAELSVSTWKLYKQMRDECVVMFEQGGSVAAQAAVKTLRLSQITSGFVGGVEKIFYDDDPSLNFNQFGSDYSDSDSQPQNDSTIKEISREKLDILIWFLKELLEQYPTLHVVTWVRFRPELFRMLKEVETLGFRMGTIHGGQKRSDRQDAMGLLHPDTSPKDCSVFVGGTYGTGSFGVNFTAANTSINCSFDYSLGKFLQSRDRVYGPGQVSPVAYYDIMAVGPSGQKTIDHAILKARNNNESIANWTSEAWVKALTEE